MDRRPILTRQRLDRTVVDIELLLIAVIQGLALTILAAKSEAVVGDPQWEYWPYMIAGFVVIINFWTLATIHSISFIRWPFDIVHTICYLLAAFVEVAALAQITHPAKWFIFMFVFFLVSVPLYAWDMKMIVERRPEFDTPARARLYAHIRDWQVRDLRLLLPAALVFQGIIVIILWQAPDLILGDNRHLYVVGAQILFGLGYLVHSLRSFDVRKRLLTDCIEAE